MQAALVLLLACLAVVLYRDRNFWFPDAEQDVVQLPLRRSSEPVTTASKGKTHDAYRPEKMLAHGKATRYQYWLCRDSTQG